MVWSPKLWCGRIVPVTDAASRGHPSFILDGPNIFLLHYPCQRAHRGYYATVISTGTNVRVKNQRRLINAPIKIPCITCFLFVLRASRPTASMLQSMAERCWLV